MSSSVLGTVRTAVYSSVSDVVSDEITVLIDNLVDFKIEVFTDGEVWDPTAASIYDSVYAATENKLDEYKF